MDASRVAVIGAGPCGLSVAHAFATARRQGATVPEVVLFEKQDQWGGLWNYSWRTGLDQYGEPVHNSMYRFLWSNGPKECLEFADYSFDEHFKQPIPSFPPREVLHNYIMGRAAKSGIEDMVRTATVCRDVRFTDGAFSVTVEDLSTHTRTTERFTHVVVATGHFSVPNMPSFPGLEKFPGRVLHSHDFRSAEEFKGKDVLVIGGSYSAEDIALQNHKYGAKSVTISFRSAAMGFDWPPTMDERPLVTGFNGSTATFKDGSTKDFDAVICCTGYQHSFPFLEDRLKLRCTNRLYPPGLYKGVASEANERLYFVGMQDQFYTFNMFDVQAWTIRDLITGRQTLPAAAERKAHEAKWVGEEEAAGDAFKQIDFQTEYCKHLAADTDYPAIDWDLIAREFKEWEHDKEGKRGILTYRNKAFRSPVTGTMAAQSKHEWLTAMDDSMAAFMSRL